MIKKPFSSFSSSKVRAITLSIAAIGLSSCLTPPMYDDMKAQETEVDKRIKSYSPITDKKSKIVNMKCGPYVDTTPISLKQPPAWLNEPITLRGRMLPLDFYMKDLLKGTDGLYIYAEPNLKSTLLTFDYHGTVKGALDYVAAQANYSYEIKDNTVVWSKFVTKTFPISFMPGSTNYFLGQQAGGAGVQQPASTAAAGSSSSTGTVVTGSSSTGTQYSNLTGTLSVWNDLRSTINNLLSSEGKANVSESTTSVTIQDRPGNVSAIEKYLTQLNKELSKQVLIKIQIIDFKSHRGFDYGIDWNLIAGSLGVQGAMATPVAISGFNAANTPGFSWVILPQALTSQQSGSAISPTQAFVNALNEQGKISFVTQPTLLTLNNQVGEININTETGYLAEVTTTVTGTSGTAQTSLTPGVVNTGFTIYLLPKIQGNKVFLQITTNLSNPPTFATATSGSGSSAQTISTPTIDEKRINQRSLIPSGGTLILAGYRQVTNQTGKSSFLGLGLLGGVGGRQEAAEAIMLVTPTILGNDEE